MWIITTVLQFLSYEKITFGNLGFLKTRRSLYYIFICSTIISALLKSTTEEAVSGKKLYTQVKKLVCQLIVFGSRLIENKVVLLG